MLRTYCLPWPTLLARSAYCREEFFRLKKVQGNKKRDAERVLNDRSEKNKEYEQDGGEVHRDEGIGGGAGGGDDVLGQGKDEDVIF